MLWVCYLVNIWNISISLVISLVVFEKKSTIIDWSDANYHYILTCKTNQMLYTNTSETYLCFAYGAFLNVSDQPVNEYHSTFLPKTADCLLAAMRPDDPCGVVLNQYQQIKELKLLEHRTASANGFGGAGQVKSPLCSGLPFCSVRDAEKQRAPLPRLGRASPDAHIQSLKPLAFSKTAEQIALPPSHRLASPSHHSIYWSPLPQAKQISPWLKTKVTEGKIEIFNWNAPSLKHRGCLHSVSGDICHTPPYCCVCEMLSHEIRENLRSLAKLFDP